MNYDKALEQMNNGATASNGLGKYDYYKIQNGKFYGFYSCDDELFELNSTELTRIKNADWYLIKDLEESK